jgi:hypothetical protein
MTGDEPREDDADIKALLVHHIPYSSPCVELLQNVLRNLDSAMSYLLRQSTHALHIAVILH